MKEKRSRQQILDLYRELDELLDEMMPDNINLVYPKKYKAYKRAKLKVKTIIKWLLEE